MSLAGIWQFSDQREGRKGELTCVSTCQQLHGRAIYSFFQGKLTVIEQRTHCGIIWRTAYEKFEGTEQAGMRISFCIYKLTYVDGPSEIVG